MTATAWSFPTEAPGGLQGLEQTHDRVQVTPFADDSLAYALVLPKGWVGQHDLGEQQMAIGNPVHLGRFADRDRPDAAVVQVSVSRLPLEVDVRDWLEFQAGQADVRLQTCQELEFARGPGVDAGGTYLEGSRQQVVRLVAFADGARVFQIMGMAPAARYPQLQQDLAIATHSFELVNPTGSPQLEQWLGVELADPAFRVAFPATWDAREAVSDVPGKKAVDIQLVTGDQVQGYVRVKAIDPAVAGEASPEELLRLATTEVQETRIEYLTPWVADETPAVKQTPDLLGGWTARGRLLGNGVELRLGLVRRGTLVFAVTLLSVAKAADRVAWMRSLRAYVIALETAQPA